MTAPAAPALVRNSAHAHPSHTPVQPPGELAAPRARDAQLAAAQARLAVLAEQAGELRRQLGKDSSTSSKPPSSDSPIGRSRRIGRCGADLDASQVSSRGRRPQHCASVLSRTAAERDGQRAHSQRRPRRGSRPRRQSADGYRRIPGRRRSQGGGIRDRLGTHQFSGPPPPQPHS